MKKKTTFIIPAIACSLFIAIAIYLSVYILSLPLSQITNDGCSGFSGYQLNNCIAYYQRLGEVATLQQEAQTSLWMLWTGLFIGSVCSFLVFPRISLSRTRKAILLFLGLLGALLLAGLPLILFTQIIINGFIFGLSLVIAFLTFELVLISGTKEDFSVEKLQSAGIIKE